MEADMRFAICVLLVGLIGAVSAKAQDPAATIQAIPCDVTVPNGRHAAGFYGNDGLSVSLGWPSGTVVFKPGGPGFVLSDGSLSMKFGWQRAVRGWLTIVGRRLDASAPPLRSHIPTGYGDSGFQATALIFPTAGCWEITGRVGDASLTFVTSVVKVGDGPARKSPRRQSRS